MKAIASWTWQRRVWVLTAALAGVFIIANVPYASAFRNVKEGEKAHPFKLSTVDGGTVEYAAPPESGVVLAFVKQGQETSEAVVKDLGKLSADVGAKTQVLAVLINPADGDAKAWVAKMGVKYPILIDTDMTVYGLYGVSVTPQTAIIAPDGVMKKETGGHTSAYLGDVEASLREALGIAAPEDLSVVVAENLPPERKKAIRELEKAKLLIKRKMKSKAIPQIKLAIESDPKYLEPHVVLGEILIDEGGDENIAEAEKHFKSAGEISPEDNKVKVGLARLKALKGDYDGAVADLEASAKMTPRSEYIYYYLGLMHEKAGKMDKAAAAYRTAFEKLQRDE
jgi:tetratricopeptide (TPR) repeat protein